MARNSLQQAQSNPASALLQPPRATTAPSTSVSTSFVVDYAIPSLMNKIQQPDPSASPVILPIFSKYAPLRGTVRIKVEDSIFYCHREVLILSSPFFESLLLGDWKENAPRTSRRQVRPSSMVEEAQAGEEEEEEECTVLRRESYMTTRTSVDHEPGEGDSAPVIPGPRSPIVSPPLSPNLGEFSSTAESILSSVVEDDDEGSEESEDDDDETICCRLRLKEEKASSFQDLLCFLYPRSEMALNWNNVGDLIKMASKFDIPTLRNACISFLLPSAAGNPLLGLKIAEENSLPELYKEASRYALDNYSNWSPEELSQLSAPTLLKLERRRSWYLERLLRLGLIPHSRDYVCHSLCPDPNLCSRLVDEKWQSALRSAFRLGGAPQPSIIYRSLRSLEPSLSSPALHLANTTCQTHARLYVADLFDRMFNLGVSSGRSWGTSYSAGGSGGSTSISRSFALSALDLPKVNNAKYFLCVEMDR